MPHAVAGLAAFVQRYGSLIRAMADRGLTRGQVRLRFQLLFPEESPALLDAAIAHLGQVFPHESTAPALNDGAVAAGVWLAVAQHLGLTPDPDHAALHLSSETVRDVTALLALSDSDGETTRRALGLIGAAQQRHGAGACPPLTVHGYERARLGLCTDTDFLCNLAHHWPAPERVVSQRLGDGRWDVALERIGLRAGHEVPADHVFTEDEYRAAVTAFLMHCRSAGHHPTTARYGRWVIEQEAGRTRRPYFDGVRRFFGSWEEAMRFASAAQPAGGHTGEGFADTRTWSDLATPEAQEMLGRAGIGVVAAGTGTTAVDENVWGDLRRLIATVLARLPWNDFLVVEYERDDDRSDAPVAWAGVGPHGAECAVVSGGQLVHAAWPVDATFFHEDEWDEPTAWDQPWTTGPLGFPDAAQKLVDGLRFGWGCSDPYRFHWGVGSFPAASREQSAVIAPERRQWGARTTSDSVDS
ncbi:TY-Chap domain-containing protein [Kocuria sp. M1R5S2]|uniref:TY-Chap domain-containing protein n=1 Tax=Kocuria rhizosphaerae TaxID=3376285 RepID=UPI0037885883